MSDPRSNVEDALLLLGSMQNVIQDTHGNVSMIDDRGHVFIKPSGVPYEEITWFDVCEVGPDGDQIFLNGENKKPSVDTPHHLSIYKRHKNIKAICHTHSPYATAYAYNNKEIVCYGTEQADFFGENIYVIGYSDLNSWGEEVAKYLHNGAKAILLGRHGTLTFGKTPKEVVKLAAALENIARKNFLAETLFNNDSNSRMSLEPLHDNEIKKWHERYYKSYGQT